MPHGLPTPPSWPSPSKLRPKDDSPHGAVAKGIRNAGLGENGSVVVQGKQDQGIGKHEQSHFLNTMS